MTRERAHELRALIKKAATTLSDEDALDGLELFAPWTYPMSYTYGNRVRYNGKLYKCIQPHTSQVDWTPDISTALFEVIAKPGDGTKEHPIAFVWNMALENGKYYMQFDVLYICIRDSIIGINADLQNLVGNYVEVVTD